MSFFIMIAVLVALVMIWDHFTPDHTDALFAAVYRKQLKEGKVAFEVKQAVKHPLASGAQDESFDASGIALMIDVRLSDIVQLKGPTATKMQRKNFDETANRMLLDRIAIDPSGGVVAVLATKGIAVDVALDVLRSANIKAFSDQASFEAEIDRHARRQTAPSKI